MDSTMSADNRCNQGLLDAAKSGDERALAVLVERHRDRLERMVRLRMDRRPSVGEFARVTGAAGWATD
jgi:hypothetical protein